MKLFLEPNIFIDVIGSREPFVADSRDVLTLCKSGQNSRKMLPLVTTNLVAKMFIHNECIDSFE